MKYYQYEKMERKIKQDQLFNEHLNQKILMRIGLANGLDEFVLFRSCPDVTQEGMSEFISIISEEVTENLKSSEHVSFYDDTSGSILMVKPEDIQYIKMERVIYGE